VVHAESGWRRDLQLRAARVILDGPSYNTQSSEVE
jgi:hypothetical protein